MVNSQLKFPPIETFKLYKLNIGDVDYRKRTSRMWTPPDFFIIIKTCGHRHFLIHLLLLSTHYHFIVLLNKYIFLEKRCGILNFALHYYAVAAAAQSKKKTCSL